MIKEKRAGRPEFLALRRAIERRDPELMIGLYADDALMRIVNRDVPKSAPLELLGKARIARYLRAVFGREISHRIEREVFEENRVVFWKVSDYPDGGLGVVETTLEFRDGEIVRQVDEVLLDGRAACEERDAKKEAVARGGER